MGRPRQRLRWIALLLLGALQTFVAPRLPRDRLQRPRLQRSAGEGSLDLSVLIVGAGPAGAVVL